jgi:uncharacterized membrane protein YdjX (TVP38/TMEM64 family)
MEASDEHPPVVDPAAPRPGAAHALLFAAREVPLRTWVWLIIVIIVGAAGAVALFHFTAFDWANVIRVVSALPAGLLLLAMAVLPVGGLPILPVYLVAGMRFGPWGGGAAVAAATVMHLVGSNLIARSVLRRPLARLLSRWHAHLPAIPPDEQRGVALVVALVPGVPYFIRNYLYPLIGLRLRRYFWIALPIYVARSYVSILLGDLGADPNRRRLLILVGVELLKAAICAFAIWRLREHHRRVHGASHPA